MTRHALAAVLALAASLAVRAADLVTMERLAPKSSWLVVGVDDLDAARARWDRTPALKWWNSEAIQKLVKEAMDESREISRKRLRELGVPEDAWSAPKVAGGSLYAARDENLDSDQAHFLIYADWGEHADGVAGIFDALLAEQDRRKPGTTKGAEIRGRKAVQITVKPEEPKPEMGKDGRPRRPRPRRGGMFGEGSMFQHVEHIWYVRDGSRFLLGSRERELEEALAALEGQAAPSVQEDPDFRAAIEQVGRGDGWAVLLTGAMQRVAGVAGPQVAFLQPMMTTLFGEVKAYGFGLRSDERPAQFELLQGIVVQGDRQGLLALPGPATAISAPPAFSAGDALGYGRMQVQFRDLMKVIDTAVASLPEEMAEGMEPTLQQYGPDLRKAFDAMGPELHVVSRLDRSKGQADSEAQGVYAVTCRDEQAVTGLLNLFLPEAGFQPRDFNGNTIFSAEGSDSSLGFGGGMVFAGSSPMVEQCLRGGEGGLAETPACRQAMAAAGSDPVIGWGYTDLVATLEASREAMIEMASRAERSAVPKTQRDMAGEVGLDIPKGLSEKLKEVDAKSLAEGFGPTQWDMRAIPNGLITRFRLLRPASE